MNKNVFEIILYELANQGYSVLYSHANHFQKDNDILLKLAHKIFCIPYVKF